MSSHLVCDGLMFQIFYFAMLVRLSFYLLETPEMFSAQEDSRRYHLNISNQSCFKEEKAIDIIKEGDRNFISFAHTKQPEHVQSVLLIGTDYSHIYLYGNCIYFIGVIVLIFITFCHAYKKYLNKPNSLKLPECALADNDSVLKLMQSSSSQTDNRHLDLLSLLPTKTKTMEYAAKKTRLELKMQSNDSSIDLES
eukprot:NODE_972_length_2665_cov_0.349961.p2 type:complete len:195 gc:universal NODE_972_length_2665_cov_0.349961:1008-424(-)